MSKITQKDSIKFAKISGDKNQIHINEHFSNKTFLKNTIVHGVNLVIFSLIKYQKKYKHNIIDKLEISFDNYCSTNEDFYVNITRSQIIIYSDKNQLLKIRINFHLDKDFNYKKIKLKAKIRSYYKVNQLFYKTNISFIYELIYLTNYIGSHKPGNGSLIHSIQIDKSLNNNTNLKIRKITNNFFIFFIRTQSHDLKVLVSKIKLFSINYRPFIISRKLKEKINNKRFLIFGKNSDFAKITFKFLDKTRAFIKYFSLKNYNKINKKKLEAIIRNYKPNYIFYYSSPKISRDFNNKSKNNEYLKVYYNNLKDLLNLLIKNKIETLIFYPSTIFLNNKKKYPHYKKYLSAKFKGEKLASVYKYKRYLKIYRLPMFKNRSNYNINGYYEGQNLSKFKKYLIDFLKDGRGGRI